MNAEKRLEIFKRLAAERPNPVSELNYDSPYQLLIAVLMSAQTTDKRVNSVTSVLFAMAPTAEKMAEMSEDAIESVIRPVGMGKTKAAHILATSKALVERFGGVVPEDEKSLTSLPGVGIKTSNVVRNVAFGAPTVAVDTHIFRVANRTGLAKAKTPLAVGASLERTTPKEFLYNAHHWLLLHGRYCCTARAPKCAECPIRDLCEFKEKTS